MKRDVFPLGVLLILTSSGLGEAAGLSVVRDEFPVNQTTAGDQNHATAAFNDNGVVLVTWHDLGGIDGSDGAVVGRIFASDGAPMGDEFVVNGEPAGFQWVPDVAVAGTHPFAVAWDSVAAGSSYEVRLALVDETGGGTGGDHLVTEQPGQSKTYPDAAMYGNGDVLVIWKQAGTDEMRYLARLHSVDGVALGPAFQVNDVPSEREPGGANQYGLPDVAVNETGYALAAWERVVDGKARIAGRRFNPYTGQFDVEVLVRPPEPDVIQRRPVVDMNEAGDMLVTWIEHPADDASAGDVRVRKYRASTGRWSPVVYPHAGLNGNQYLPTVGLTERGASVVLWTSQAPSGAEDVLMRLYNANGWPLSGEIVVNTTRFGIRKRPALALAEYDDHILMLIAWESAGQDGSATGVYAKLYRIDVP